ncbi:uncharacterized protein [Spinacia oleracea]|uniref:Transposase-associated domain-containing protein n=1 Tax=Spinacia oleracea TaxID=3562 RepID=A0ABM3QRM2_SPIOL|nr:uncharacterized protein LOC130461787 [Spinacia oleracea]
MESKSREWMQCKKNDPRYKIGVKQFIEFAFSQKNVKDVVPCPCVKCNNERRKCRDEIELDLLKFGIVKSYTRWLRHGESISDQTTHNNIINESNEFQEHEHDEMLDMLHEAFGVPLENYAEGERNKVSEGGDPKDAAEAFYKLMGDLELELYPGCKQFSKLSFLVKLFHIKCLTGIPNKSLEMVLNLFKEALPKDNTLPESYYEAEKIIKNLSLESIKIDACPNNCILFWKEHADANECVKCHASRWKKNEPSSESSTSQSKPKKIPSKTMRYFPLIPRLQRIFMSTKTAASMRWHSDERADDPDGVMRHPADSKAWKSFDEQYPTFASEPRNVRLGLASDGFSPFRNGHIPHSTWPVFLIPYNLPPWLCMKQQSFILSMLIPGPKGPKDKIDVYLQPLIEELKLLWEVGVETYDASKKENFRMFASLLWTISDYPAYGDLSGWSTGGAVGCPSCNSDTCSRWLSNGGKHCYMGHRRFLPMSHMWRYDGSTFDGKQELRPKPKQLSGEELLQQVNDEQAASKHTSKKRRRTKKKQKATKLWRKKSIFFELPYWSSLLIRHNLDVMHIEKNVCETLLGTLLDIEGKSKDNMKARLDLEEMNIRKSLHPIRDPNNPTEIPKEFPPAPFTLSLEQKRNMCNFLTSVKFPDGYASNISRNSSLKERKLSGLKSHDYHVILEHLLPLAIRDLPVSLSAPLIKLSEFFRELCSKALKIDELEKLEEQIGVTLCELERIFPPSFFVIIMHLPVHLASEALIAGPVQYRWMYPIERYAKLCYLVFLFFG